MTTNPTPTIEPWAMDALRELVDIAALLNDEQFISHEEDPRVTIIDRLTMLIQSLVIEHEPLDPQGAVVLPDPVTFFGSEYLASPAEFRSASQPHEDDDRRVFFVPEDGIPIEVRPQDDPDLPY